MDKFKGNLAEYLLPYWNTDKIVNETIAFVGDEKGTLMYLPSEIISVKDYFLEREYILSKDYIVDGKNIIRLNGGNMPYWETDEYYTTSYDAFPIGVSDEVQKKFKEKRYLHFGETDTFTKKQIAVTYRTKEKWQGELPQGKSHKFTKTLTKLRNKEALKMLFYGDSITTGCNASGTSQGGNTPPYMPPFDKMVKWYLENNYRTEIELINTAVGGMNTKWGYDNLEKNVISYAPDLVVVAFGMNDAMTPLSVYRQLIKGMIDRMHKSLPYTEIMLLSSILPNYQSDKNWFGNQRFFYKELMSLEGEYDFVGVGNVTGIHQQLIAMGKSYRDMTGNNINHPNDFTVRLYAQVILKTLLSTEYDK